MLVPAAVAGIVDQDERSHRRLDDTSGSFAAGSFCRYGRIVTDEMREHPDTSKMRGDRPAFHRLSVEARSFRPRVIPTARIRKPRRSCVRTPYCNKSFISWASAGSTLSRRYERDRVSQDLFC